MKKLISIYDLQIFRFYPLSPNYPFYKVILVSVQSRTWHNELSSMSQVLYS